MSDSPEQTASIRPAYLDATLDAAPADRATAVGPVRQFGDYELLEEIAGGEWASSTERGKSA